MSRESGAYEDRDRSRVAPSEIDEPWPNWKVALDRGLGLLALILALPLLLISMILVKLTSRGPVIYTQTRVGRWGRAFTIYKIRSMTHDCERKSGARWASLTGDPRVTLVGHVLRKTHIDELPQIWNVLRGEMSLVGPRPERPEFVGELDKAVPHYRRRLEVLPGITGLAQVQLPPDTDYNSVRRKLACDLYYVRHMSLWLDLRIILSTAAGALGVPFPTSQKVLNLPSGEPVETAYYSLSISSGMSSVAFAGDMSVS